MKVAPRTRGRQAGKGGSSAGGRAVSPSRLPLRLAISGASVSSDLRIWLASWGVAATGVQASRTSGHLALAIGTLHDSPDATRVFVDQAKDGLSATALP